MLAHRMSAPVFPKANHWSTYPENFNHQTGKIKIEAQTDEEQDGAHQIHDIVAKAFRVDSLEL